MIIAFFGPDGAGKTTIARLVVQYLERKGLKVAYVRLRSHHMGMYILLQLLRLLKVMPCTHSPRILDYSMRRIFRQSKVFLYIETLNVLLWLLVNVRLKLLMGRIIVAERYIPDFLVSLQMISSRMDYIYGMTLLGVLVTKFVCHENIIYVYLTAKPEILCKRKKDEELSQLYVRFTLILYRDVIDLLSQCVPRVKFLPIDTSEQPHIQTLKQVLKACYIRT